ncbi:MAG: hypothetical protein LAO04_23010, partial [Acidobacteriia bacterium]|nr:hypothetical protein [Terriglobia bacterium]
MKRIPWLVIIPIVVIGCLWYLFKGSSSDLKKTEQRQTEAANKRRQTREQVSEMASRYGAVTDWGRGLKGVRRYRNAYT